MLRVCTKGHLTGTRHCVMCGADAGATLEQNRPMSINRKFRRQLGAAWDRLGLPNYDKSRRETRVGAGVHGPNKIQNIP